MKCKNLETPKSTKLSQHLIVGINIKETHSVEVSVNSQYCLTSQMAFWTVTSYRCHVYEFKMSYGTQYCYELTLISESLKGPQLWGYLRFPCFRTGDVYIMGLLHFHSCINLGELPSYSNCGEAPGELSQSSSECCRSDRLCSSIILIAFILLLEANESPSSIA